MLFVPVTLTPALAPKETGGSPEFPGYPCEHMPRSQTPVVSHPLALARLGLLPSGSSIPSALGPFTRTYPLDHHNVFFGVQLRGLRPCLPSASDTASQRSPFGSAIDPVANLGSSGILRISPHHPLGNYDDFQGCHPILSSRASLGTSSSSLMFSDKRFFVFIDISIATVRNRDYRSSPSIPRTLAANSR